LGSNKDITITITDDDVPMVEWAEGIVRVGEDADRVTQTGPCDWLVWRLLLCG
jgi:hypothetical protein